MKNFLLSTTMVATGVIDQAQTNPNPQNLNYIFQFVLEY